MTTATPSIPPHASTPPVDDPALVSQFIGGLFGRAAGGAATLLCDVAHRVGLFETMADRSGTVDELAAAAGLSARHLREVLDGLTASGVVTLDPDSRIYALPASHARCLTGPGPSNYAPNLAGLALMASFVDEVAQTVRDGGGIPYAAYRPAFTELMDLSQRRVYDAVLVDGYVPAVPALRERLVRGARVADLGCGTGHVVCLLAEAFPASQFVGYDLATDAIDRARDEATRCGLANATFEVADVAGLDTEPRFDIIVAFDAIHDLPDPLRVLRRARSALHPDGLLVVVDLDLSSDVLENVQNPLAPWFYMVSLFHCMQVSLAAGGVGLGACWGRQLAQQTLASAGFHDITVIESPGEDQINVIYTARPTAGHEQEMVR
jgi:SAM-dependent methyltransferase